MNVFSWGNSKVKKLNWLDMGLVKLACMVFGILLAVLIPSLVKVNIWLLVTIVVILAIKPAMKVLKK
jgi:hypothetical protein